MAGRGRWRRTGPGRFHGHFPGRPRFFWTCKRSCGCACVRWNGAASGCGWSDRGSPRAWSNPAGPGISAPHPAPAQIIPSPPPPPGPVLAVGRPPGVPMPAPEPPPAENSDLQLVERTVAGDQRAYELLVIKYQRRIERLIGRMVRDTDLVQDIAQETFIRAYRALHQFRGDAQFYTWLYRIAVNSAKKALMEMKRNPVISENALRGNEQEDETSYPGHELTSDETPETVLAAQEVAQAVNAAVQDLPEDLRQAVVLREIEGLSYEEIAAAMGCPIGTVRSRIFRAREAISAKVRPLLENQSGKRW